MPLIRRLPKRGFNNAAFHKNYAIVNLTDLSRFKPGSVVNEKLLRESKIVRGDIAGIKILGEGELKHPLTIEADKVSASARGKIDKAGGTIVPRVREDGGAPVANGGEGAEPAVREKPNQTEAKAPIKKKSIRLKQASRVKGPKKAPGER